MEKICVDYRFRAPRTEVFDSGWKSYGFFSNGAIFLLLRLFIICRRSKVNCIVAGSDCLLVIWGYILSKFTKSKLVVDLYDEYTVFGMAKLPFLKKLYIHSLKHAHIIVVASDNLRTWLGNHCINTAVSLVENAINLQDFYPRSLSACRDELGVNRSGKTLVGLSGGLDAHHGGRFLLDCVRLLGERRTDVIFCIATNSKCSEKFSELTNVDFFGHLDSSKMNSFYNAMDLCVVHMAKGDFGDFAFPQKAFEIVAAKRPFVYARVGILETRFSDEHAAGYSYGDPESFYEAVCFQLEEKQISSVTPLTWEQQADKYAKLLNGAS